MGLEINKYPRTQRSLETLAKVAIIFSLNISKIYCKCRFPHHWDKNLRGAAGAPDSPQEAPSVQSSMLWKYHYFLCVLT